MLKTVIAALVFLAVGFGVWFLTLGFDLVSVVTQTSRHMHDNIFHAFSLTSYSVFFYPSSFAVSSFLISFLRWAPKSVFLTPIAYGAFLLIYLPLLSRPLKFDANFLILFSPVVAAFLGAYLGSLAWKAKNRTEQCGADNPGPCGTSGTSDAGASAPPEASGGI